MRKLQKLRFRLAQYIGQTIEAGGDLYGWQPFYEFFVDAAQDRAQVVAKKRTEPFEYALNRIQADGEAVFALCELRELIAWSEVGKDYLTADLIAWYASDMQRTCDELLSVAAARNCEIARLSPLEADDPCEVSKWKIGHDGYVFEVQELMKGFKIDDTEAGLYCFLSWVACGLRLTDLDQKSNALRTKMEFAQPANRLGACCSYLSVCNALVDDILRFAKDIDAYIDALLQKARGVEDDASVAACLEIAHVLKIRHFVRQMCSFFVTQLGAGLDDCRQCVTGCAELVRSSDAPRAVLES